MLVQPRDAAPVSMRELLVRGRLLAVMRGRWERRVTVLVAGSGFGKTSLLTQAVAENAIDPLGVDCWVSCDADDRLASVLGEALCASIGTERCADTDPDVIADAVAAAVAQRAPLPVSVILDDVHVIATGSMGARLLGRLIEILPANGHLVMASRGSLPAGVARLVALGDAVLLQENDLSFSDEELGAFAALRGVDVEILDGSGGWPTLAELAVSAGHPLAREFLWDEVLTSLSDTQRRDLAVLVAIGGGDDETLAAALSPLAAGTLRQLVADLPLVSVAEDGRCTPHALWGPALEDQLDVDARRCAQRQAGTFLARRGDARRAFPLLAAAEAWPDVRDLIRRTCVHHHTQVSLDVLESWKQHLSAARDDEPEVALLVGVALVEGQSDAVRARPALEQAAVGFAARGDLDGELACCTQLAQVGYWTADAELIRTSLRRAMEIQEAKNPAGPFTAYSRAVLADFEGDSHRALHELRIARAASVSEPWTATVDWLEAESLIHLGEPERAVPFAEAGCARAPGMFRGVVEDTRLLALWLSGRVDEVLAERNVATEHQEASGGVQQRQAALAHAARFAAYVGDIDAARRSLRECDALGEPGFPGVAFRMETARAAYAVAAGDEQQASAILAAHIGVHGLGGFNSNQRRALPLFYVLVPDCRPYWEAADLGPCFAIARSLARRVVAAREGDPANPLEDPLPDPGIVRSFLPLPWATLLAVAASSSDGAALLDALGPDSRPFVAALATSSYRSIAASARRLLAAIPAEPAQRLRIDVLGPLELCWDGQLANPREIRRERVRQLLGYLVHHRKATRQAIIAALWPDLDDQAAQNNLRVTLSYLVRILEPDHLDGEACFFVRQDQDSLRLNGEPHLSVDAWDFERHLDEAALAERHGTPSLALDALLRAVGLWRGPYLQDAGADWSELETERLRLRYLDATTRAGELLLATGDSVQPGRLAQEVLRLEPWSERAYRLLAATHLARGDRPAAQHTLARCTAMLMDLGVDPEPETAMLDRRARAQPNMR